MTTNELAKKIAVALAGDEDFESVQVLDEDGEYGNEGILSIMFPGEEEAVFVTLSMDE